MNLLQRLKDDYKQKQSYLKHLEKKTEEAKQDLIEMSEVIEHIEKLPRYKEGSYE